MERPGQGHLALGFALAPCLLVACGQEDPPRQFEFDCAVVEADGDSCTSSLILDNTNPFVPREPVACVESWSTDVPLRSPDWFTGIALPPGDGGAPVVRALPDGAVLVTNLAVHWFTEDGSLRREVAHEACQDAPGCGFGLYNGSVELRPGTHSVVLGAGGPDGVRVVEVAGPNGTPQTAVFDLPVAEPRVVRLFHLPQGGTILVGESALGGKGFYLRVDDDLGLIEQGVWDVPQIEGFAASFAMFDGDTVMVFISDSIYSVQVEVGGVQVTPLGLVQKPFVAGVATGGDFLMIPATLDLESFDAAVEKLDDPLGDPTWTRVHRRLESSWALFNDISGAEPLFAAGGYDGAWWWSGSIWTSFWGQPFLMAFDGEGIPQWLSRLAVSGSVRSVDVGSEMVVAAGSSRTPCNGSGDWIFVAGWDR